MKNSVKYRCWLLAAATLISASLWAQPPHARAHGKHHKKHHAARPLPPGARPLPPHPAVAARHPKGHKVKYYYYPGANVYYHPGKKRYAYYRGGGWVWVNTLPPAVVVAGAPYHVVYYDGPQVWMANPVHVQQYRPGVQVSVQF